MASRIARVLRRALVAAAFGAVAVLPAGIASADLVAGGGTSLATMSCPTSTLCVTDDLTTFSPAHPSAATYISGNDDEGVSCVTARLCVVESSNGLARYDPVSGIAPEAPTAAPAQSLRPGAIQCLSTSLCVTIGGYNPVYFPVGSTFTYDPQRNLLSPGLSAADVADATCAAQTECLAVSTTGEVESWDPQAAYNLPDPTPVDLASAPRTVACPVATRCVLGDTSGGLVSFDPTDPADATRRVIEAGRGIADIACPTSSQCTAVDTGGGEVTFSPLSLTIDSTASLVSHDGLESISCPSATECVAGGDLQTGVTFNPARPTSARVFSLGESTSPPPTRPSPASRDGHPTITGRLIVGRTLTGEPGVWFGSAPIAYRYRWSRCARRRCISIPGGTRSRLRLGPKTGGEQIRLTVTAHNSVGRATASFRTHRTTQQPPPAALVTAGRGAAAGPTHTSAGRTVVVPDVTGEIDYAQAYATLHHAGLSVSTSASFQLNDGPTPCPPFVGHQTPAAGRRVPAGSDVTLRAGIDPCGVGSPALPPGGLPRYTVPDFRGALLTVPVAWAERHRISWSVSDLPRLRRGTAPTLIGNYRVTRQSPAPGKTLGYGFGHRSGNSGTFTVTPLQLEVRQSRPTNRGRPRTATL